MPLKVIVWGTGSVGRLALREIARNAQFELIGVKVYSDHKVGKLAAELAAPGASFSATVTAVKDPADLPIATADCIYYCPMIFDHDEIASLLRQGANVVCTASNSYPLFYGEAVFDKLDQAGKDGGSSFHGSGINPAFISDVLVLTMSGLVHRASKIIAREASDATHYVETAPEIMCDHLGFGKVPAEAMHMDDFAKGMTAYFSESIRAITDHLGVELERVEEHHEVAATKVRIDLANGRVIEPGTVGCRLFEWHGIVGGEARIVLSTMWKLTSELDPAWDVPADDLMQWTVTIEGTPAVRTVVQSANSFDPSNPGYLKGGCEAGMESTSVHALNAIPYVVAAEPGVRTFLDMTIISSAGALRS